MCVCVCVWGGGGGVTKFKSMGDAGRVAELVAGEGVEGRVDD